MDIRQITNLAYTPPATGFPDKVRDFGDDLTYKGISKIWRGMVKVAASGFGKGVLLAAAIIVGGAAVISGYQAAAGALVSSTGITATIDQGVMIGAKKALAFLFGSGLGYATLAISGTLGSVADVMKHQDSISEEVAIAQAKQFEKARSGQVDKQPQQTLGIPEVETSYKGYKKPTNGKAAQSLATASMLQDEPVCDTFCQQEEDRRAARIIAGRAF